MVGISDDFADFFMGHQVRLTRYEAGLRRRITATLEALKQELRTKIFVWDLEGVTRTSARYARTERLLQDVTETIRTYYGRAELELKGELRELVKYQAGAIPAGINAFLKADILSITLNPTELRVLADSANILGGPANLWWEAQEAATRRTFSTQIRQGVISGETNDQLIRRVLGRSQGRQTITLASGKTKSVGIYRGGVLDASRKQAEALVRTSVQSVSNKVNEELYKQNSDIIEGRQALVTLDGRTTLICISRSGAMWDGEGRPKPESPYRGDYPGEPPWHWNCRTVIIPLLLSWEEIAATAGYKLEAQKVPVGTRASMDGQVAGNLTYESWLKQKPVSFQKEVLGSGRWDLWQSGKISASQLADFSGRPLTIEQLKQLTN